MTGYLGDAAATTAAIDAEGWLHTGDLGWLDAAGRLHVEGRLGDVIERDGERWLPSDVEALLVGCAGVAEAVVVGVDRPGGADHEVVAFVRPDVAADGARGALVEAELRAAVAAAWGERRPVDRYM